MRAADHRPRLRAGTSPGAYEWRELPGIGHFPQEEAPDVVSAAIADWAT